MQVEINTEFEEAKTVVRTATGATTFTPPINEDYWIARVRLYADQAILAFPKFFTIGCGFAQEEDWNTNLPLEVDAETIFDHIKCNKKYEQISDDECIEAIRMLQAALLKAKVTGVTAEA